MLRDPHVHMLNQSCQVAIAFAAMLLPALAAAHPSGHAAEHLHGGFSAGLLHPLSGLDHVIAMVAVGIWASRRGGRMLWALPLAFVAAMTAAGALAMAGLPLPFVEPGIAASILAIGLVIAIHPRIPDSAAVALCALFAIFHGHAHGAELAEPAGAAPYTAGFALATAALHGTGLALGACMRRALPSEPRNAWAYRLAGTTVAAAGALILAGVL